MAHGRSVRPPYYIASRLCVAAVTNWNVFNGWCQARGVKPKKLDCADFQDLVLFWLMEHRDEESLHELERELTMPPPNTEVAANDPNWGADAEMAMFMDAMG